LIDRGLQERRGLLFCKEERKILCRLCDVPLHTATQMMRRHSRFLLTGVRLSLAPVDPPAVPEKKSQEEENSSSLRNAGSCSVAGATTASASSISEYLTKTLPGWQVEDFLFDDADAGIATCSDGLDPVSSMIPSRAQLQKCHCNVRTPCAHHVITAWPGPAHRAVEKTPLPEAGRRSSTTFGNIF
jgi:hypothetical protein